MDVDAIITAALGGGPPPPLVTAPPDVAAHLDSLGRQAIAAERTLAAMRRDIDALRALTGIPLVDGAASYADRIWSKVNQTPEHWLWTAASTAGRGQARDRDGKLRYAYRLVWELHHDAPLPEHARLRRSCPVTLCVRPSHYLVGGLSDDEAASLSAAVPDLRRDFAGIRGRPRQARCRQGHEITTRPNGRRSCLTCDRERHDARRDERRGLTVAARAQRDRETAATVADLDAALAVAPQGMPPDAPRFDSGPPYTHRRQPKQ